MNEFCDPSFVQGKREKKSSKKSKKAGVAAATVEVAEDEESGATGGGGAPELFDLDIGSSQQKQPPVSRFQVLAEDESLKMVSKAVTKLLWKKAFNV